MLSRAIIIGEITQKICKMLKSGAKMISLNVSTVRSYIDSHGKEFETTSRHNIHLYGKLAEKLDSDIFEGDTVYVDGNIQNNFVADDSGVTKGSYMYCIKACEVRKLNFGPKRNDAGFLDTDFDFM